MLPKESPEFRLPFEYTFEEFADHFAAQTIVRDYEYVTRDGRQVKIDDLVEANSYESTVLKGWDYFHQIYPPDEAMEKGSLFMLMCSHLAQNMDFYNTGDIAVQGSSESGSLVSESLLRAVHFYFTTRPLSDIPKSDAVPREIVLLAKTRFKDFK